MAGKGISFTPELRDYLLTHSTEVNPVLKDLVTETDSLMGELSIMQIATEQGGFMAMLTAIVDPAFAVEVGTFTGYSAICIASSLSEGARLLCCDVSDEFTQTARKYFDTAGVSNRVDLVIAPALDTLDALSHDRTIDLAFIDADKSNYANYYELILARMDSGGLIVVDNVLWSGTVISNDEDEGDTDLDAIRAFNDMVVADERVTVSMVNVGDGLSLIRKR